MWKASKPENYNNFRVFIMGICGNTNIFGNGVLYEGSNNTELRKYRGQSGSQDDIIPTLDIFTGVYKHYPNNELTNYLLDMRSYRPIPIQNFLNDLEKNSINYNGLSINELKILYGILEEIYNFRNGHWMFVIKYIMNNTRYNIATGGTPITTWLPNQIEAVLDNSYIIINLINDYDYKNEKFKELLLKSKILLSQIEELKKNNYDVELVYNLEDKFKEI